MPANRELDKYIIVLPSSLVTSSKEQQDKGAQLNELHTAEKEEKDFKNQLSTHLSHNQGRSVEDGDESRGPGQVQHGLGKNTVKNTFHTNNSKLTC